MVLFLSFMNLFRNFRRTAAILLTVALGTGVLFSFKGFISGVLNQYRESTIHAHYGHGQIHTKNYRETVYAEPWKHWIDNGKEIESFLKNDPAVEYIFPRNNFAALLKKGNVTMSGFGHGIDAENESKFFDRLNIELGSPLTNQQDGIILGRGLAKALNVKPGDNITIAVNAIDGTLMEQIFTVTGIFHTGSLDFDSRIFRIQIKKAQSLLKTSEIELISLGLKSHSEWPEFSKRFHKAFPNLEATSFDILDKVYYQHSVDWLNAQFRVIQVIILSIVILGIFNSVSASILERKQEIGNFRANGESIFDCMKLVTFEGAFLGLLGSALGLGLAFIVMKLFLENGLEMPPGPGLTRPFYICFHFEWNMVFSTLGLSTGASIIASFLAGIKVTRMPIAKALRSY